MREEVSSKFAHVVVFMDQILNENQCSLGFMDCKVFLKAKMEGGSLDTRKVWSQKITRPVLLE